MGGPANKKRSMSGKFQRPHKKQRRVPKRIQQNYNSDSSEDEVEAQDQDQDFDAVNLLDSDDDIHNAKVDDVGAKDDDDSDMSSSEEETSAKKSKPAAAKGKLKAKMPAAKKARDESDDEEQDDEDEEEDEDDDDEEEGLDDLEDNDEFDLDGDNNTSKKPKKRNDPSAFATSLSKILSTKLASSKRADPVLSRSAAAHETSKAVLDSALEAKAKRQLKQQKQKAMEKGRVKDVLLGSRSEDSNAVEPETSTAEILALEAKLRKVAQRGVVKMFNAVRAAQVKSTEAERNVRADGMLGMGRREEKVNEMSKKGFLDLIASGGGVLKKGGLEEA